MPRIQGKAPPLEISHAIVRVFREQNRLHGRAVAPFGLSTEQAHLLMVLWTRGPMSVTELMREVALSSGTLSAALQRMEDAGLVRRVPDPRDRRATRVEPAAWSASKRASLVASLEETEDEILAPLSSKERDTFHEMLVRVLANLSSSAR
jgi:DNA-binding MarR family transcriptional regulator